jgi:prophage antirepressor-like protein
MTLELENKLKKAKSLTQHYHKLDAMEELNKQQNIHQKQAELVQESGYYLVIVY